MKIFKTFLFIISLCALFSNQVSAMEQSGQDIENDFKIEVEGLSDGQLEQLILQAKAEREVRAQKARKQVKEGTFKRSSPELSRIFEE